MPYQAILFDMDGVLIDTHWPVTDFWQKYARRYGVQISQADWTQHIYGCPAAHTLDVVFPHLPAGDRQAILNDLVTYEVNLTYTAMAGAVPFLHLLARHNIPLALVTSGEMWKVNAVTAQLGLDNIFAACVTAGDIRQGKPHPDCYLLAAQQLQKRPEQCLVFEDSISGVTAAATAGAYCIGVQMPEHAAALLRAGARHVVPDFTAVSVQAGAGGSQNGLYLHLNGGHMLALAGGALPRTGKEGV